MAPTARQATRSSKPMAKKQLAALREAAARRARALLKELGNYDEAFGSTPRAPTAI